MKRSQIIVIPWALTWLIGVGAEAAECPKYAAGVSQGLVSDPTLVEASGLAASRQDPGVLWSHNDSGSPPSLYALDETGAPLAVMDVLGAANVDWEVWLQEIQSGPDGEC